MTPAEFTDAVERVVNVEATFPTPTARKRGRNPEWPYVPVLDYGDGPGTQTTQILGRAFKTREAAVGFATEHVAAARCALRASLHDPRMRALRVFHGLPREIPAS